MRLNFLDIISPYILYKLYHRMTPTKFKKNFSKALLKLEPVKIDLDAVIEILKKVKIEQQTESS